MVVEPYVPQEQIWGTYCCADKGDKALRCGISTACFYPESTYESLLHVIDAGAKVTEIFLNTFHELEDDYVAKLEDAVQQAGIQVLSLHPFSSAMEGFFFATDYAGRMQDGLALYRRYFETCKRLGAKYLVFHGDHANNPGHFPDDRYTKHFKTLAALGREYGVQLCHENVFYCRLNSPERVAEMRRLFGTDAAFVLDTKQLHRQGAEMADMLDAMGGDIRHVHISDFNGKADCISPGHGDFDIEGFLRALLAQGYTGDILIELYRDGYKNKAELAQSMRFMNELIAKVQQGQRPCAHSDTVGKEEAV